jgi:hypothetical protein
MVAENQTRIKTYSDGITLTEGMKKTIINIRKVSIPFGKKLALSKRHERNLKNAKKRT